MDDSEKTEVTIHGPPNVDHFLAAMRLFCKRCVCFLIILTAQRSNCYPERNPL